MFIWQSETLFFDYWALMLFSGYSSQILRKSLKPMDGLQLSQNLQFCPQNSIFPWELLETPTFSFKLLVMKNCPLNNIYYCFSNNKIIIKKDARYLKCRTKATLHLKKSYSFHIQTWNVVILCLSEMQFTFPRAAFMVLCFLMVGRKVLTLQRCLATPEQGWHSIRTIFPTFHPHQKAEGGRDLRRGHNQDRWPQLTKEIFLILW